MNERTAQSDTKNNQLLENQEDSGKIELGYKSTWQYTTGSTASGTSSTSGFVEISPSPAPPPASKKQLQLAIYAHIQAIRALGRTEINTQEIADALCISVQEVNDALEVLKKQGVRRR